MMANAHGAKDRFLWLSGKKTFERFGFKGSREPRTELSKRWLLKKCFSLKSAINWMNFYAATFISSLSFFSPCMKKITTDLKHLFLLEIQDRGQQLQALNLLVLLLPVAHRDTLRVSV